MAVNSKALYGLDVACSEDADDLLTEAVGLAVVRQDALHRLLTDDVLGLDGTGWGYDCRKLLGMTADRAKLLGPILTDVLTRDDRIDNADVTITVSETQTGLDEVVISAVCYTAAGPFDLTLNVNDFSETTLTGQSA